MSSPLRLRWPRNDGDRGGTEPLACYTLLSTPGSFGPKQSVGVCALGLSVWRAEDADLLLFPQRSNPKASPVTHHEPSSPRSPNTHVQGAGGRVAEARNVEVAVGSGECSAQQQPQRLPALPPLPSFPPAPLQKGLGLEFGPGIPSAGGVVGEGRRQAREWSRRRLWVGALRRWHG